MGALLNASTTMICPHGGQVQAITSNTQAKAQDFILRATDTFTIAGCSFNPGFPHPCVTVQWIVTATRVKAGGDLALTTDSVGLCLAADQAPQGTVQIIPNQQNATAQ